MMDINTTPLIDVMLVLLIMFIITIPIQTHAVKLDLPVNQPNQAPPPINPLKNIVVDQRPGPDPVERQPGDAWSSCASISTSTQQMNPVPELHLQPDATARYELVDEVLASPSRRTSRRWASSATNII